MHSFALSIIELTACCFVGYVNCLVYHILQVLAITEALLYWLENYTFTYLLFEMYYLNLTPDCFLNLFACALYR